MHEGPGSGYERAPSKAEKLLQSWKEGPVILASGSSFKLENLKALGMTHAMSMAVPEEIEEEVFRNVEGRSMRMPEMVAAMVAKEKVAHVLESGVPDDALVCGFDTVVMETTGSLSGKKRQFPQKPGSRDEAAARLIEYFTNLVEEKMWKDDVTRDLVAEAARMGRPEALESMLSVGYPQTLIHITTGMAVRTPYSGKHIDMKPAIMRLVPATIHALAPFPAGERMKRVEEMVEKALSIMDENERWRSITTGLDYSDPRIKELLGLTEAKILADMDESESGIMKGMPQQEFERYLAALARESAET